MDSDATVGAVAKKALQHLQAEAEGLNLVRSEKSSTGYRNVVYRDYDTNGTPYQTQVFRSGKMVILGKFDTAEEAALCYARSPEGQAYLAAARAPAPLFMTSEEALRLAEAEGLTFEPSESSSGYKGVAMDSRRTHTRFKADIRVSGKNIAIGYFETAEEAALCRARAMKERGIEPPPPPAPVRPPMTAEEAVAAAEAEGLTLERSTTNSSGFRHVCVTRPNGGWRAKPYEAQVRRGGKCVTIGCYATAEEGEATARLEPSRLKILRRR